MAFFVQQVLDGDTLRKYSTVQVALGSHSFSEDGSLWAYTLGSGGSDWRTLHISRVGEGGRQDLDETLQHVKFSSLAWTHDHKVPRCCAVLLVKSMAAVATTMHHKDAPTRTSTGLVLQPVSRAKDRR